MPVAASATAAPAATGAHRRVMAATGAGGGKDGKLLGQFFRPAVRAGGSLPIAGADEDFAVALAFLAMEFVNRHGEKITRPTKSSSAVWRGETTNESFKIVAADVSRLKIIYGGFDI